MPDHVPVTHPDISTFVNSSNVYLGTAANGTLTMPGQRVSQITDANNFTYSYTFGSPDVIALPSFPQPV